MRPEKLLIFGYGNPSRGDDGIGWALCEKLESVLKSGSEGLRIEYEKALQLNIEDAVNIEGYDRLVFIDAAAAGGEPFVYSPLIPSKNITFTSHIIGPESILAIHEDMYGRIPEAWLLAVRGYDFDFSEKLSEKAGRNLDEAYEFMKRKLKEREA